MSICISEFATSLGTTDLYGTIHIKQHQKSKEKITNANAVSHCGPLEFQSAANSNAILRVFLSWLFHNTSLTVL